MVTIFILSEINQQSMIWEIQGVYAPFSEPSRTIQKFLDDKATRKVEEFQLNSIREPVATYYSKEDFINKKSYA